MRQLAAIRHADSQLHLAVEKTEESREIFFMTYTAFATTEEVFCSFVRRFYDAETSNPRCNIQSCNEQVI